MWEVVVTVVCLIIAIGTFIIGVRSLQEKGFLFNNAYLYTSRKERENMDKKPYYRQTGVVFLAIGAIFLLNSVEMLFLTGWMNYIVIVIAVATIIYAIGSSIVLERKKKGKKV